MKINIQNDKYEIINTGSIILPKSDYIEFSFENLNFRVICKEEKKEDGTPTDSRYKTRLVKDNNGNVLYMELSIYNITGSTFSATENMIGLGFLSNHSLKLNFAINEISNSTYLFVYTWYLFKEIEGEKNEGK